MRSGLSRPALTPCSLVLIAFPAAFLFMPEGLPFVYAGCGGGLSSCVTNMQGTNDSCAFNNGSDLAGVVDSYSLDNTSVACEFKATVTFRLFDVSGFPSCTAKKARQCGPDWCVLDDPLASGEGTYTESITNQCNDSADTNRIIISIPDCGCTTYGGGNQIFHATASSQACNN
jgi:hypothetical protein